MIFRWTLTTVTAMAAAFALMVMLVSFPQPSPDSCCEAAQAAIRVDGVRLADPK